MCPVCSERGLDAQGARLVCGTCSGVLVTEAEVRRLVADAKKHWVNDIVDEAPLELGEVASAEPVRRCPSCMTAMTKHDLYGVIVDRCGAHGVWFDGEELAKILAHVGLEDFKWRDLKAKVAGGLMIAAYIALGVLGFLGG